MRTVTQCALNPGKLHVTTGSAVVGNEARVAVARIVRHFHVWLGSWVSPDGVWTVSLERRNACTAGVATSQLPQPSRVRRQRAISVHRLGRNDLIVETTEEEHLVLHPRAADRCSRELIIKSRRLRQTFPPNGIFLLVRQSRKRRVALRAVNRPMPYIAA